MLTRRMFMKIMGLIGPALALPSLKKIRAASVSVSFGDFPALGAAGGSAVMTQGGREILLIRDTADTVVALDAKCTHRGCTVAYQKATNDIACPCHFSRFKLDGGVLAGPAKKPLKTFPAALSDDGVVVTLDG